MYDLNDFYNKYSNKHKAEFDKTITLTNRYVFGIKTSILDKKARDLAKNNVSIYDIAMDSHESILLIGFLIAYEDANIIERLKHLEYLLPFMDNWAYTDSIVPRLKILKNEKQFFINLLKSKNPFYRRVGIIFLQKFYLGQDLKTTLSLISKIKDDNYYVKMAIAWTLAEGMVYNFDYTLSIMEAINDKFIKMKTYQKAIEYYRISNSQKTILRNMKAQTLRQLSYKQQVSSESNQI